VIPLHNREPTDNGEVDQNKYPNRDVDAARAPARIEPQKPATYCKNREASKNKRIDECQ